VQQEGSVAIEAQQLQLAVYANSANARQSVYFSNAAHFLSYSNEQLQEFQRLDHELFFFDACSNVLKHGACTSFACVAVNDCALP
jgi:hypothetical protein